jgi:hypothetical protein
MTPIDMLLFRNRLLLLRLLVGLIGLLLVESEGFASVRWDAADCSWSTAIVEDDGAVVAEASSRSSNAWMSSASPLRLAGSDSERKFGRIPIRIYRTSAKIREGESSRPAASTIDDNDDGGGGNVGGFWFRSIGLRDTIDLTKALDKRAP